MFNRQGRITPKYLRTWLVNTEVEALGRSTQPEGVTSLDHLPEAKFWSPRTPVVGITISGHLRVRSDDDVQICREDGEEQIEAHYDRACVLKPQSV